MSQTNNPCENWNQNIHRYVPPMPRRVWQYEHPDRVREMKRTLEDLMVPETMSAEEFVRWVYDGE